MRRCESASSGWALVPSHTQPPRPYPRCGRLEDVSRWTKRMGFTSRSRWAMHKMPIDGHVIQMACHGIISADDILEMPTCIARTMFCLVGESPSMPSVYVHSSWGFIGFSNDAFDSITIQTPRWSSIVRGKDKTKLHPTHTFTPTVTTPSPTPNGSRYLSSCVPEKSTRARPRACASSTLE